MNHHPHSVSRHALSRGLKLTGHLSRRAVIAGLAGVTGLAVVGGGVALLTYAHGPQKSFTPPVPTSTPTPTPTATPTSTPTPSPTPITNVYHVIVNAAQDVPGLDTGIDLPSGSRVTIMAQGSALYGSEGSGYCDGYPSTNPDGQRNVSGSSCTPKIDPSAVLPSAPIGELIGSIGQPGTTSATGWFAIGSSYSVTISTGGRLFLLYNDDSGYYGDNTGSYHVTITVTGPSV